MEKAQKRPEKFSGIFENVPNDTPLPNAKLPRLEEFQLWNVRARTETPELLATMVILTIYPPVVIKSSS